jgi:hypothetical protein
MKTQSNTVGKKSFGQTMREGAKALGGRDVANYSLFFHSPTKRHRAGDHMVVIVPYIELGRSSDCQVQFGDDFPTVSRKHAAIRWDNNRVMVKQLSDTNTTTIRRYPQGSVEVLSMEGQEAELTNGDQMQLSNDGPIVAFNATETKTSNMGFTQRLQLFSQQALRPYKTAVASLAALLLLSTAGFLYLTYNQGQQIAENIEVIDGLTSKYSEAKAKMKRMETADGVSEDEIKKQEEKIEKLRVRVANAEDAERRRRADAARKKDEAARKKREESEKESEKELGEELGFEAFQSSVYYIFVDEITVTHPNLGPKVVVLNDKEVQKWSGTGFLTTDSRLITARHVIQGWRFQPGCGNLGAVNQVETTGGKVNVRYRAVSKNGTEFTFTNEEVNYTDAEDYLSKDECADLDKLKVVDLRKKYSDWAYVDFTGRKAGNIIYDRELSKNLRQGETLHVMGYNYGLAMQSGGAKNLDPLYSKCTVAQSKNNLKMINVTNIGYGSGCSGGPVFAIRNGKAYAVGIVSYQIGGTNGQIVSIDNMYGS